jgi:hypothetical protein
VIVARTPGRRLLWRQEWSDPLPFGVGQFRRPRRRRRCCEPDAWTVPLLGASEGMALCGHGLMRAAPQRPLEAEGPLLAAAGES